MSLLTKTGVSASVKICLTLTDRKIVVNSLEVKSLEHEAHAIILVEKRVQTGQAVRLSRDLILRRIFRYSI